MLSFALACAFGCLIRYGSEIIAGRLFSVQRLWATMAVNIVGSGLVGLVASGWTVHNLVAFCGGLTSFSAAFAGPAQAWRDGPRGPAVASLVATPLLCVAAYIIAVNL